MPKTTDTLYSSVLLGTDDLVLDKEEHLEIKKMDHLRPPQNLRVKLLCSDTLFHVIDWTGGLNIISEFTIAGSDMSYKYKRLKSSNIFRQRNTIYMPTAVA